MLLSAVEQSESAICIHIYPYPLPLAPSSHPPYLPPLGGHKAPSWFPCAMQLLPTSYFTCGSVYMSILPSRLIPASPSPHHLKSIPYVCVFIPVLPLGSSEPFSFEFHIYVLAHGNCFSLTYFPLHDWQTIGSSTSVQITQFRFFLWLSNIPLYICATSSISIHLSMHT